MSIAISDTITTDRPHSVAEKPGQRAWRSQETRSAYRRWAASHLLFVRSSCVQDRGDHVRTLVLAVVLIAWLATGIITGSPWARQHDRLLDRFLWLLLAAASGALIVPLALGAGRREEPIGQPTSPLGGKTDPFLSWSRSMTRRRWPQRRAVGSSTGTKGRRDARDHCCATPDRPDQGRAAGAERSSVERARHRSRGRARVLSGK
jgi:hypothetical protein